MSPLPSQDIASLPMVELLNGALWWAVAAVHGASIATAVWWVFVTAMVVLALVDLEHQLLPDAVTLPGVALGLAASSCPVRVWDRWRRGPPRLRLRGDGQCGQGLQVVEGRGGLGQGDWKLVAMIGAFFGCARRFSWSSCLPLGDARRARPGRSAK